MNDRQLDPVAAHNRAAWNRQATSGSRWTTPVSSRTIQRARAGQWRVILTPKRPVPMAGFGELADRDVLCLASGGGQHLVPVFHKRALCNPEADRGLLREGVIQACSRG